MRFRSTKSAYEVPAVGSSDDKPAGPRHGAAGQRGFTLLELVIVMTIMIILAAIGVSNYQSLQLHAKESVLKQDLRDMRKAIDQYAADKEHLPASLEDLVTDGYILKIPIDPITSADDWKVDIEEDTISREGGQGVVDVHSSASGEGTDGTPYSDY